jgi:hypothetical protein
MIDSGARGVIAEGEPNQLREASPDQRVREFLNRRVAAVQQQQGILHP